jgi:hypothetical protein
MKRSSLFSAVAVVSLAALPVGLRAQAAPAAPVLNLEGDWAGTIGPDGAQQHVTWHITKSGAGWGCTVDDPERGAADVECSVTSAVNPVVFEVPVVGGKFTGTVKGDTLTGAYSESGPDTPGVFTRAGVATAVPEK